MAKQETTCDDILKELRAKQYRPVYYLMGEESYYIDLISDYIVDNVLTDTEKEFNLTVVYGADVDIATVINAAKRYPMMSERQVVVVKEAQAIRNMEELLILPAKTVELHHSCSMPQTWGAGQKKEAGGRNREGGSSIRIQEGEGCPVTGIHHLIHEAQRCRLGS